MIYKQKWVSDCGTVTLYQGDCKDILPTLDKVDAVVTDPPYEISCSGGGIGGRRKYLQDTRGFTDCGFDYSILINFKNWVVFGTLKQVPKLIELSSGKRWMLITWNKQNPTPLCQGNYLPDTEYIVHVWDKGCLYGKYQDKSRFIVHPVQDKQHGEHPNEKPIAVMLKVLSTASDVGHLILDPFMGSGTTGVACVRTGRKFIGIEIDEHYFNVAKQRIIQELLQPKLPFNEPQPKVEQEVFL